eukprot:Pgem_evm1s3133
MYKLRYPNFNVVAVTFDALVKIAQLDECAINCSALLVDESQDMNLCQLSWL